MIIFELFWIILTLDSLSTVRAIVMISGFVLGIILCRLVSRKNVLLIGIAAFLLMVLGVIVFFAGNLAGWGLLSFNLPFFICFAITAGMYYFVRAVRAEIKRAKQGLEQEWDNRES